MRFLADENFNIDIVRGLLRRKTDLDIVRVQDVGLSGADDPTVLEWAAREGRVLFTHDVSTITNYAYERISAGKPMPAPKPKKTKCLSTFPGICYNQL